MTEHLICLKSIFSTCSVSFLRKQTYFVVMSNILQSDVFMNKVYDLKGSSQGRTNKKIKVRDKTILKDTDLDFHFYVDSLARHRLLKQTKLDCELLEDQGIMDYSLMLGLQVKGSCQGSVDGLSPVYDSFTSRDSVDSNSSKLMKTASNSPDRSSTIENSVIESVASISPSPAPTKASDSSQGSIASIPKITDIFRNSSSTNFGMKIPGRARRIERGESGSVMGKNIREEEEWYDVILYLGIIDIFQDWCVRKRIEHCYKSIQHRSKTISAVHPKTHSSRFQGFVSQIFLPEKDHPYHSY
ncbi:hypothetical protein IGI04_032831 [Brassica rapa subsp. trilocularis]|uniref:1-phosphatidylinositol-4-phosphate 5-kinase n=1 Tax=Brassica rapa subsp. trilocularis TaxID=1813537 RepID=A0ABQ7LXJ6_BRACM|nr:hypothetical protein IGI04_032831 [Brassica rapa subsp. trilocularis]